MNDKITDENYKKFIEDFRRNSLEEFMYSSQIPIDPIIDVTENFNLVRYVGKNFSESLISDQIDKKQYTLILFCHEKHSDCKENFHQFKLSMTLLQKDYEKTREAFKFDVLSLLQFGFVDIAENEIKFIDKRKITSSIYLFEKNNIKHKKYDKETFIYPSLLLKWLVNEIHSFDRISDRKKEDL